MSEGISGPELGWAGAFGRSGSGDRFTFGRGVEPFGLRKPGEPSFLRCGVEGNPPTPRRTCGVPFIARLWLSVVCFSAA